MFQRLEKLRKNAFGSMAVFGENNNNTIAGVWFWKGQELAFPVSLFLNFFFSICVKVIIAIRMMWKFNFRSTETTCRRLNKLTWPFDKIKKKYSESNENYSKIWILFSNLSFAQIGQLITNRTNGVKWTRMTKPIVNWSMTCSCGKVKSKARSTTAAKYSNK